MIVRFFFFLRFSTFQAKRLKENQLGHVSVEDAVLEQYKLQGWKGISDECRVFKYFRRFVFNLFS